MKIGVFKDITSTTYSIIISSVALLATIAWDDVIETLFTEYFPIKTDTLQSKIIYAIMVTITVYFILKLLHKEKKIKSK